MNGVHMKYNEHCSKSSKNFDADLTAMVTRTYRQSIWRSEAMGKRPVVKLCVGIAKPCVGTSKHVHITGANEAAAYP
jgi:hypothetical protein